MNKVKEVLSFSKLNFLFDLFMICIGIIGTIGGLVHALYFPEGTMTGVYFLCAFGIVQYILYQKNQTKISKIALFSGMFIFFMIIVLYLREFITLIENIRTVIKFDYFLRFDSLLVMTQNVFEADFFFILFIMLVGIPISTMIVSVVLKARFLFIKLFILLLLMIFPLFIKHDIQVYTSYCVAFFLLYQYVFAFTLNKQKKNAMTQVIILSSLSLIMFCSHIFLEGNPIFSEDSKSILTHILSLFEETSIDIKGSKITGISTSVDGSLPDGNVTLSDGVAMTVTSSKPLTSYIRGYSLTHYEGNQWKPVINEFNGENPMLFYPRYLASSVVGEKSVTVKIDSKKKTSYQFVPYFSMLDTAIFEDSYYQNTAEQLRVFSPNVDNEKYKYRERKEEHSDYTAYAKNEYTEVPISIAESIKDMLMTHYKVEYNNLSSADMTTEAKINTVKRILSEWAKYDLKAGQLPIGKDFVEYFLNENRKGSCTHFATTGTLMLRTFGVPARYTSGFIMKESDFVDGVATIKNSRAHAWVEVYYDGVGWLPYEMTPATTGEGSSIENIGTMLDDYSTQQTPQNPENPQEPETPNTPSEIPNQNNTDNKEPWYQVIIDYGYYIIGLIGFIFILILYRIITRKWFFILIKNKSQNEKIILYYQRMKILTRFGLDIDESIYNIAMKAKFSPYILEDEQKIIEDYYHQFNHDTYIQLTWYKKVIYKYIYGYI